MQDWLPELSDDDFETMIDALEAWEQKSLPGEMMGDIIEAALTRGEPRAMAEFDRVRQAETAKRDREKAIRKERSILLRAKLLTLRDRRRVERALSQTETPDKRS